MYSLITEHIELDREQRHVRKDGEDVHLTGLEYGLLEYLTAHPNRICTRQELLDHVWGDRFLYDTGTIDVHLNALRRKMGWGVKMPIQAVRGVGFIFRIERTVTQHTIDLHTFLAEWLQSHEVEIASAGLVPQMNLTPFINEITIEPKALKKLLDSVLATFLPNAKPGVLKLTSRLTMHHFSLSLDINGTTNELSVPLG